MNQFTALKTLILATLLLGGYCVRANPSPNLVQPGSIKLWLDANHTSASDTTWLDRSSSGNNATKHGSPSLITSAQNQLPVMRYSGANGEYHSFSNISDIRTVFWVLKHSGGFWFILGDNNKYDFHQDASGVFSPNFSNVNIRNGSFFINGSISAINAPWPSELSIISLRTTGNVEASNFSVDRNVNGRNANGDLAELIIYNQALTDLEIQTVEGYLAQKWGLIEDLPPQHPYGPKLVNFTGSSPLTVLENQPVGTILGDFNTTGFDSNANLTFSLVNGVGDGNNSLFRMETNGTLKTATTFDYESNASTYHIRVQASDESGTNAEGNFTVSLLNEYEPSKSNHSVLGASAMEMIWVEPGTFTMGSPSSEVGRSSNETENNVTFTQGFYLGKYEVTQAEYLNVMQGNPYGLSANPSNYKNTSNPVTNISWQDVEKFCQVLNLREKNAGRLPAGWAYTLPTEAQWEYACRAGTSTRFSWGEGEGSSLANYNGFVGQHSVVGLYAPNFFGLYDMHGNVTEHTADWNAPLTSNAKTDPSGPSNGAQRTKRGGSYTFPASGIRSAKRLSGTPDSRYINLGFRLSFQNVGNSKPFDLFNTQPLSFAENISPGTIITSFGATELDQSDTLVYSLVSGVGDGNNSLFTMDGNGSLRTATSFDFESNASSYSIRVQARDGSNASTSLSFSLELIDLFEDADGDGFEDHIESSAGSNVNDAGSTPFNHGLVAWYPFDGNASDMSGNGNDLTLHGNPTLIPSNIGGGIRFDGQDDYAVRARLLSSNTPFTWSFWIQENENGVVMCQGHSSAVSPAVELSQANFKLYTYTSVEHILTLPTSYSNQSEWRHYVAIRDNDGVKRLYQNGKYLGESDNTSAFGQNCSFFYVGGNIGYNSFTKMDLKKIRVYNRPLSAKEVSALYRAESPNYFADAADHLEMIWVDSGTFTMGLNDSNNASPEHNVTLTQGFYLGKYEVTQAQYEAVMRGNANGLSATPSQFSGNPSFPVEKVSWNDIQVFLARLNQQEADNLPQGWAYALPTEAEWEYACRAGTNTTYSWGDTISTTDANWNHGNDANRTEKVGSYLPNPWGFYDMHGNVCEWVADRYANYNPNIVFDPQGALTGNPVRRGGSWNMQGNFLLSSSRSFINPSFRGVWVGFRLALKKVSFTPLTDDNFNSAIDLWFSDEATAIETYSHISNWDVSQVTDFDGIFRERASFNEDISRWDTSSATSMARLFYKATSFNQDISGWDTSSVTNFSQIFREARSFDQNISAWDTSSVTSFNQAFWDATDFNGDIGDWDTSSVVDMAHMFRGASSFNQDIGNWNTSKVSSMHYIFYDAESFNQNIGGWDVSNIQDMRSMFEGATAFNGDISDWDTSSVTHFRWMFKNAISFNQDIGDWNTSSAETVMDMFNGAVSFDQDISRWDLSSTPSMTDMFGAEDGLSIFNKSKIQQAFSVSPRWPYQWFTNYSPHSLKEMQPLVVSTSQPIGTLVGRIRAENAEANESLEYAFVPMFDPFWAKNDNSMKVWLDAADASYIEEVNGAVLRWNNKTDQQPNLVPQEGGGNPSTGWRKHHGLNVIDFDGASGLISPDAVELGSNFSILMVAGIDQVDTNVDTLISSYRGGSPAHFYIRSAQEGVFNTRFQNNGMGSMRNFTPDSEMGPAIYEFIFNLEEEFLYCRINGEEYGKTGYWTAPDPTNYLRVFNKQGDGASRGYIDGFLAELLIFNKALLGGQRTEVENYLGAKWGIDVHIPKPTKNFELRANGEIYTTAVFGHGSEGDYEFQFRAMDEWNQTVEQTLTIRVVNADPHKLLPSGDLSIHENRPVGSIVGSFTGADPDGDAVTFNLVNSNTEIGKLFRIDQKGRLTTKAILDYEVHGKINSIGVEIIDEYGGRLVKDFALEILNVIEDFDGDGVEDFYDPDDDNDGFSDEEEIAYGSGPRDRNSVANMAPESLELFAELSIRENQPAGTLVGSVLVMDRDGDLDEIRVENVNGKSIETFFYIDGNGSLRTAKKLDFESTPFIEFRIVATDEHKASISKVYSLKVEDVYEPSEPGHVVESAVGLEMIWVEPGTFFMGSPETEDAKHAKREQQHKVTLTQGYYLGKYEVTQEQYEKVMTGNASGLSAAPSKWKGSGKLPVEKVSVQDVKVFLDRLNTLENDAGRLRGGWAYVLPTEAEWEYACRAGTTTSFAFGNEITQSEANFDKGISYPTVEVGQYPPNHWGFFDMHGNVAEWTSSYFGDYPLEAVIDPLGPLSGTNIVSRGGSWKNTADAVRSAVRIIAYTKNHRVAHHGFRMVYKPITKAPVSLVSNEKLSIFENEPIGTWVGQFSATDPEGEPLTYDLVDGDGSEGNDHFFIDGNGSLRSGVIFDYELGRKTLSIRVQASDIHRASVERIFRVKIKDKSELIPDGRLGESGWYTSRWFGSYLPFPSGWIYHELLKWVYLHPDGADGNWIWQNVMGWMWTKSDLYPYLWSHEKKEWLYLLRSDEEGILYYKYSDKTIHQFNDKFDIPVSKYPKFSWDHIPRYMHTYKLTDFEQEELEYLAQFPLITIEKAQAIQQGGNNFVQRGTTVAAEGIKALNPDAKVLYYKNIIIDWHGSEATPALEAIENSYLKKTDGEFLTIGNRNRQYFDVSMPAVRNWWIEDASRMLNESSIDGLFIDAHPKVIRDWWMPKRGIPVEKWEEVYAGYLTLLEKINQTFSSQNILLANLIRSDLSEQGGREYLHFFDGSYLEHFSNDNLYDGKKADYIAMGINHVQQAARDGNIIAFTMKLGGEDGEDDLQSVDEVNLERLNYITALFLVMAEKYSYYFPYGGTYGADAGRDATWMHTFPIFKKKLGPPKGPAVQEGYIYTREFEHCRVILDIEKEKGTLFWEEDSSR